MTAFFKLAENSTTARTEIAAGLTTFLTMSYIIFVQPQVLGAAGMDQGAVFTATCLASALACIIMGLAANYPIAQAPLMGENFFFTYTVVLGMGMLWQEALGLVFISGVVFMLLTLTKIREQLVSAVPDSLKFGISAGIGLFITFIGLKEAGIIVASPATLVELGPIKETPVLIAITGFGITAVLFARSVPGAILIGMLCTGLLAWLSGTTLITAVFSAPPSLTPTLFQFKLSNLLTVNGISIVLIFLFMTIFDTLGTLVGVSVQAGIMKDGKLPRASRALLSDAVATTAGACLGTSTVSSYIESSTGVAQGGRTGLTAITTGILFLAALFFSPLVQAVGGPVKLHDGALIHPVTAPALIMVGALMMTCVRHIDWDDISEYLPAFLTIALIPFTFNIADGIAAGFISYPLLKTARGRARDISVLSWIVAGIFILRYICL
ncbi:MAG: NCS2 family permease [Deltaproteobacteria bacterium]|nr:NCS2 family permease [Deltaproteobacteria bacterium]